MYNVSNLWQEILIRTYTFICQRPLTPLATSQGHSTGQAKKMGTPTKASITRVDNASLMRRFVLKVRCFEKADHSGGHGPITDGLI